MVNKHLHAAIYCRSARNSARALVDQEKRCKRKAVEEGAESTVTIIDRAPGASSQNRPAIAELRSLLGRRHIDLVVVDRPSRLTRRSADLRAFVQDVSRAGARLVFVGP